MKNGRQIVIPVLLMLLFSAGLVFQISNMKNASLSSDTDSAILNYIESYDSFQEDSIQQKKIKSLCTRLDYYPVITTGNRNLHKELEFLDLSFREYTCNVRLKSFLTHLYTAQA